MYGYDPYELRKNGAIMNLSLFSIYLLFLRSSLGFHIPYTPPPQYPPAIVRSIKSQTPSPIEKSYMESQIQKYISDQDASHTLIPLPNTEHANAKVILNPSPLFGKNGPKKEDVVQGQTGDCYLLAVLAGLAEKTDYLRSIIQATDKTATQFRVHYYDYTTGEKEFMDVFDTSYVNFNNVPIYAGDNPELAPMQRVSWVKILENWFAKYNELKVVISDDLGYSGIGKGGWPDIPYKLLTGKNLIYNKVKDFTHKSLEAFTQAMSKANSDGFIILASRPDSSLRELPGGHAYFVLGVEHDQVALYNPWGMKVHISISKLFKNTMSYYKN